MKLGSLFDGSGAFPFAGVLCGIEPIWASEIEKFPIEVTKKRFPNMKHLGDVCKIDGGKIEPVDVITFGSPCFPAGTLVLTDSGYVEIENIKVGDNVLTHENRYRNVTAVGSKTAETIILSDGKHKLECTPNHPIYTLNKDFSMGWTLAEDMLGKMWAMPISEIDKDEQPRKTIDSHAWFTVTSVISMGVKQTVYNMSVDEDNSYTADKIVVHNCQDLSIAGQRAGLEEGERSNLFYEAIRIIKEMREATNGRYPTFAVWENVTGVLTSNKGKDFQAVLQNFVGLTDERAVIPRPQGDGGWRNEGIILGDNHSVAWRVLSAEYWGVPQKRRRIFLVADFRGQRAPKILFEREGLSRDFATVKGAWGRIDTDCEVGVDEAGEFARRGVVAIENHPADSRIKEMNGDVCQTLTSRMGTGGGNVPMVAEDVTFFDRAMFNQGTNAKMPPAARTDDKASTLVARGPGAVAYSFSPKSQSRTTSVNKANVLVATDYKDPQCVTYEQNGDGGGQSLLRTHEMVRLSDNGRKDVDDGSDRL